MKRLQEAIQKLEDLQQSSKGSFVGAGDEIIIFMRHDLQGVIDSLKDVQNGMENKSDHGCTQDHLINQKRDDI